MNEPELNEAEISTYDADDIFEKHGVRGASLMSPDQLKAVYKKLALQHHPDRGGDTRTMQDINAAYDALEGGKGTGADNTPFYTYRTRSTNNDYQDSVKKLDKLSRYLISKFKKSVYEFDGDIIIEMSHRMRGMITVYISGECIVRQILIVYRDNKFKIDNVMDNDELEEIRDDDFESVFNYIDIIIQKKRRKKSRI